MSDETKKQAAKRSYMVLKQVAAEPGPDPAIYQERVPVTDGAIGTPAVAGAWTELGIFTATSEAQALAQAIELEPEVSRGGTYVGLARWQPRTAAVKPVTQTKLEWT